MGSKARKTWCKYQIALIKTESGGSGRVLKRYVHLIYEQFYNGNPMKAQHVFFPKIMNGHDGELRSVDLDDLFWGVLVKAVRWLVGAY